MTQGFGQLLGALIRERREAAGLSQFELAEESFPDLNDHEGKERRIRELEAGDVTRPQAKNYTPICETLNIDRAMIRALKQRAVDAKAQRNAEFIEAFPSTDAVTDALQTPAALTRVELEILAVSFGAVAPYSRSSSYLRDFLMDKANHYRALLRAIGRLEATYGDVESEIINFALRPERQLGSKSDPNPDEKVVMIPFRGNIAGGVPIETIHVPTARLVGRFASLRQLATEHLLQGDFVAARTLCAAAGGQI